MQYYAYIRVSTASQESSLDSQKRAIVTYMAPQGVRPHQIQFYEDLGVSGAKHSRPALDQMLKDIGGTSGVTVICYSLSRLGRSVTHLLALIEHFQANKVTLMSVTEQLDISTPFGRLILNVLASLAQMERELIVSRVRTGLEGARARGSKLGRPRKRNSELIRELRAQGMSHRKIAKLAKCSTWSVAQELRLRVEKDSA
jgi:DNA invertase Pin-like site-specific DNA recombinase